MYLRIHYYLIEFAIFWWDETASTSFHQLTSFQVGLPFATPLAKPWLELKPTRRVVPHVWKMPGNLSFNWCIPKKGNVSWICMMSSGSCSYKLEAMFVCFVCYFFWGGRDVQDVSKTTPPWKCPKRWGDKRISTGKPSFDDPPCRRSLE